MEAALGSGHGALDKRKDAAFDPNVEVLDGEGARFKLARAAQTPELFGHFVDKNGFGFVDGLVLGAKIVFEAIELGRVLAVND